jgi:hypothetical protein
MWKPTKIEIEKVSALDAKARYGYFIKRVADTKEVWSLWSDGWVLVGDDDGRELVPLWPHSEYARRYATVDWAGYKPKRIALDDFLEKWIPGMKRDNRWVSVFPVLTGKTRGGKSAAVDPDRLRADLELELEKYQLSPERAGKE